MHGKTYALTAVLAITAWTGAPAHGEAGVICKSMTWGFGLNADKATSRALAYHDWKAKAGQGWTNYNLAKSVSRYCRKESRKWHCGFKAIPCKTLGLSGQSTSTQEPAKLRTRRAKPRRWTPAPIKTGRSGLGPGIAIQRALSRRDFKP